MLERRERKSSEDGPDKVMKSIRNIIREKRNYMNRKKCKIYVWSKYFYGNCYSCHWN